MHSVSFQPTRNSRRKGVALIIVLAILILVTALVVGFLIRTGSERTAAASYRATARTRQLADTVVNLVQAQINQGTTTVISGSTYAWASQPGAIRVFDNAGNQTIYKLYSSGTMVTTNYSTIAGDMPFSSGSSPWLNSPSLWVDLNAPAAFTISGSATLAYPILDPRNPNPAPWSGDFTTGTRPGFQVNPSLIGLTESQAAPIAPMPAQWLYVLQDGTIVPPGPGSTGTSIIITATNVSASNPIVGRVAFWTDDDTCRLNINTAGDGTFWDTPRYNSPDEWIMAYYSPSEYEYQRYPGHPATTSLLPLLGVINPSAFPPNSYQPTYTISLPASGGNFSYPPTNLPYAATAYQNLFGTGTNGNGVPIIGLLPQYAYGGSEEGTVPQSVVYSQNSPNYAAQNACPLNNQRLFSSVGEMLFSATAYSTASPPSRSLMAVSGTSLLTRQQLETAKFFLTAHSRAPELTLFGTPRVSMWPFTAKTSFLPATNTSVTLSGTQVVPPMFATVGSQNLQWNTPTDQLLAFAATLNETGTASTSGTSIYPYYFMRISNIDPYTDINITRNGAAQNQQLLDYLDSMMSMPVPGLSTESFYNKYSQVGSRQLLTEIFDYVRTTDTEDGVISASPQNASVRPSGSAATGGVNCIFGQTANLDWAGAGNGNVVPTLNSMWATTTGTLEGFGTFPRPVCVTLHFVTLGCGPLPTGTSGSTPAINIPSQTFVTASNNNAYDTANIQSSGATTSPQNQGVVSPGLIAIQAYVYVQFIMPASGRVASEPPGFWITMTGLDDLALSAWGITQNLGFLHSASLCYNDNLGGGVGWVFNQGGGDNDQFVGPIPIFGETNGGAGGPNGRSSHPSTGNYGPSNYNNSSQYNYPFYSKIITLPYITGSNNRMVLTGGNNVVMQLQDAISTYPPDTIQTVNLNFASAAQTGGSLPFPVNSVATPGTVDASGSDNYQQAAGYFLSNARIIATGSFVSTGTSNNVANADMTQNDRWDEGVGNTIDQYHDTTASLVLNGSAGWSDPRMLAIANVPSSAFVAHPRWGQQMAHDLSSSCDFAPMPGSTTAGKLQAGANYGTVASATSVTVYSSRQLSGTAWPCVETSSSNGVAFNVVAGASTSGSFADWDNGPGYMSDGPWINRPDEGGASTGAQYSGNASFYYLPYFTGGNGSTLMGPGIFSPNREVCSPVMFGSLPTGVPAGLAISGTANPQPWQTLLFRPGAQIGHPGAGRPVEGHPPYTVLPDDFLLDLFWMPVAEPYAISEPFSTAGKVNLNYQILPFGYVTTSSTTAYIRRDTGIRSALASLKIAAVPLGSAGTYKAWTANENWWGQFPTFPTFNRAYSSGNVARLPIDSDQTLQQFDSTFENGTIFESGAQICDMYLVPQGYNLSSFSGSPSTAGSWYGSDFSMVGDNVRERPYADIYSRITTKSNTYTVYFTVQELKNSPTSPPNQWNEATGTVGGEYRGSKDMERYIQQSNSMPNFLTYPAPNPVLSGTASLESFYRWRIIEDNQFAP